MRRLPGTLPVYRFAVRTGTVTLLVIAGGLSPIHASRRGVFVVDVERIAEEILRDFRAAA